MAVWCTMAPSLTATLFAGGLYTYTALLADKPKLVDSVWYMISVWCCTVDVNGFGVMIYCTCCSSIVVKIMRAWLPSVLWCCWSGSRKGIRPVKTERWGAGMVICLERGADLQMAQLMLLPLTVSCFSKIRIGFTFVVPAHPGSPGKGAVKQVCVFWGLDICFWR